MPRHKDPMRGQGVRLLSTGPDTLQTANGRQPTPSLLAPLWSCLPMGWPRPGSWTDLWNSPGSRSDSTRLGLSFLSWTRRECRCSSQLPKDSAPCLHPRTWAGGARRAARCCRARRWPGGPCRSSAAGRCACCGAGSPPGRRSGSTP